MASKKRLCAHLYGAIEFLSKMVEVIYGRAIATAMRRLGSRGFDAVAGSARSGGVRGSRGISNVLMARCRRTYMAAS